MAKPSQKVVLMERFKIDHDVPIPSKKIKRKQTDYPFEQMEIGDSFAVPILSISTEDANREIRHLRHSLPAQAGGVARSMGMNAKFVTCYMPDEKAVRIWRVEKSKEKPR